MLRLMEPDRISTEAMPVILLGAESSGIEVVSRLLADHLGIDFSTSDGLIPPSQPEGWGFKIVGCIDELPLIAELYPDARILHVVRDGRDVVLSRPGAADGSLDIFRAAADWANTVERIGNFVSRLPAHRALEIRYEDLLLKPVETLEQLIQFLAIDGQTGPASAELRHAFQRDVMLRRLPEAGAEIPKGELRLFERIADSALYRYAYKFTKRQQSVRKSHFLRALGVCDSRIRAWVTGRRENDMLHGLQPVATGRLSVARRWAQ